MAKRGRNRGKRTAKEWMQLVVRQRASGQSMRAFALTHGLAESTLGYWSRRFRREEELGGGKLEVHAGTESRTGTLVELVNRPPAVSAEGEGQDLRLMVGGGVCLVLSELPAPEYLALVARSYEGASI